MGFIGFSRLAGARLARLRPLDAMRQRWRRRKLTDGPRGGNARGVAPEAPEKRKRYRRAGPPSRAAAAPPGRRSSPRGGARACSSAPAPAVGARSSPAWPGRGPAKARAGSSPAPPHGRRGSGRRLDRGGRFEPRERAAAAASRPASPARRDAVRGAATAGTSPSGRSEVRPVPSARRSKRTRLRALGVGDERLGLGPGQRRPLVDGLLAGPAGAPPVIAADGAPPGRPRTARRRARSRANGEPGHRVPPWRPRTRDGRGRSAALGGGQRCVPVTGAGGSSSGTLAGRPVLPSLAKSSRQCGS